MDTNGLMVGDGLLINSLTGIKYEMVIETDIKRLWIFIWSETS